MGKETCLYEVEFDTYENNINPIIKVQATSAGDAADRAVAKIVPGHPLYGNILWASLDVMIWSYEDECEYQPNLDLYNFIDSFGYVEASPRRISDESGTYKLCPDGYYQVIRIQRMYPQAIPAWSMNSKPSKRKLSLKKPRRH